jgi:hypothetical protein
MFLNEESIMDWQEQLACLSMPRSFLGMTPLFFCFL